MNIPEARSLDAVRESALYFSKKKNSLFTIPKGTLMG